MKSYDLDRVNQLDGQRSDLLRLLDATEKAVAFDVTAKFSNGATEGIYSMHGSRGLPSAKVDRAAIAAVKALVIVDLNHRLQDVEAKLVELGVELEDPEPMKAAGSS